MGEIQLELEYVVGEHDPVCLMEQLCSAVDRFNEYWPQFVVAIEAFRIPFYEDGLVPERIEPESVSGEEAINLCMHAFRSFSRPHLQHPGSVYRVPGYILLDRLLLDEINIINSLKNELRASIELLYPQARARNSFYRRVFPGRIMLQIFRQIRTTESPVQAVNFSWSPGTHAPTRLTKGEAIELLQSHLDAGTATKRHRQALDMAIASVRMLSTSVNIISEKPRAPYPVANIVHTPGRNGIRKMVPLSLPLFVGPGPDSEKTRIGALAPYDATIRRRSRSDRLKPTLLYGPLNLYYR